MKKQTLTLVGVLSLLMIAGSAFAQSQAVRADVPFSFMINHTTMPAGPYTISPIGNGGHVLLIKSENGQEAQMAISNSVASPKAADRSKLVFHCYGGDPCFLYQIWVSGNSRGQQLPQGAAEKEVAANLNSRDVPVLASLR